MAHAGDDEGGDGGDEAGQKDQQAPILAGPEGHEERHQRDAAQDQRDPRGDGGGKTVHVLIVGGGVLPEAAGYVAPQERVHVAAEQVAQPQDGVHLRVGGVGLPLAHRLAGHVHFLRQILLGHAPELAEELQVFSKCHHE